jgi:hypothetical protein
MMRIKKIIKYFCIKILTITLTEISIYFIVGISHILKFIVKSIKLK